MSVYVVGSKEKKNEQQIWGIFGKSNTVDFERNYLGAARELSKSLGK